MRFGYLTLFTALIISLSAAVYSILGLTAIFAAAFWPIVIMGGSLEFGKIVTTLWLHKYWDRAEIQYKLYLCSAVAILMLLTSMGVFGFLSKAHSDQSLVSGDAGAKLAIYDEKIKISRENIDANRRALQQMDAAVDQTMGRSTDEKGADKAVAIRRSQQAERGRLLKEIEAEQKKITALNEERAPLAAENRKIEAEVGPIKYIAALIYGDNPDANILEKSVRWVIILIVIVFDPLALTLLLAATKALEWEHGLDIFAPKKKDDEEEEQVKEEKEPEGDIPVFEREDIPLEEPEPVKEEPKKSFFGYGGSWQFGRSKPTEEPAPTPVEEPVFISRIAVPESNPGLSVTPTESPLERVLADAERARNTDDELDGTDIQNQVMTAWKSANPGETFKKYYQLLKEGKIDRLPWEEDTHLEKLKLSDRDIINYKQATQLQADNVPPALQTVTSFGTTLPEHANKGDLFLRVDQLPTVLYKFNGTNWITVDKASTDSYVYDEAYIDHLIERIDQGQYDPDLLSDAEREQIAIRLTKDQG